MDNTEIFLEINKGIKDDNIPVEKIIERFFPEASAHLKRLLTRNFTRMRQNYIGNKRKK